MVERQLPKLNTGFRLPSPAPLRAQMGSLPKQTTVRLPDDLANEAEAVARVQGSSVNQLIIDYSLPRSSADMGAEGFPAAKIISRVHACMNACAHL
jgi:hypothetical protein